MGASDTTIVRTTPHYIHQIVLSKATIVTHKIAHHWHDKNLQKANSAGCLLQHTHRKLLHFGNIRRIEPRMYNSQTFAATCGYTFTREQSIWMLFLGSPQWSDLSSCWCLPSERRHSLCFGIRSRTAKNTSLLFLGFWMPVVASLGDRNDTWVSCVWSQKGNCGKWDRSVAVPLPGVTEAASTWAPRYVWIPPGTPVSSKIGYCEAMEPERPALRFYVWIEAWTTLSAPTAPTLYSCEAQCGRVDQSANPNGYPISHTCLPRKSRLSIYLTAARVILGFVE